MNTNINEKVMAIKENPEILAALENAEDILTIQKVLASQGIDFSEEETEAIVAMVAKADELDSDQLDSVAGGLIIKTKRFSIETSFKEVRNFGVMFINLGIRLGNAALRNNAKLMKYI